MLNEQDREEVEKCLPVKGSQVNLSRKGRIEFSDGTVIVHETINDDYTGLYVFFKEINLINQNSIKFFFLLSPTEYSPFTKILIVNLISKDEITKFIKSCQIGKNSKKFDL